MKTLSKILIALFLSITMLACVSCSKVECEMCEEKVYEFSAYTVSNPLLGTMKICKDCKEKIENGSWF